MRGGGSILKRYNRVHNQSSARSKIHTHTHTHTQGV
jgi:hypothetical protein